MPKRISEELEDAIIYDIQYSSLSFKSIAKKHGVSQKCIGSVNKRNNIPKRIRQGGRIAIDYNYFNNIDTAGCRRRSCRDKAYFLGFITADGHIRYNPEKYTSGFLQITLANEDIEVLKKFKEFINSDHKISIFKNPLNVKNPEGIYCKFYAGCKKICLDLIKYGVGPEKSNKLSLPEISDELMCHYIRGVFDGDGCFYIKDIHDIEFNICSSVEHYMCSLQEYLINKLSFKSKTKLTGNVNSDKYFCMRYGGSLQVKKFYDYIYGSGGPWLTRKFKKSTDYFLKIGLLKESDIPKENLPFELQNFIEIEEQEENIEEEQQEILPKNLQF